MSVCCWLSTLQVFVDQQSIACMGMPEFMCRVSGTLSGTFGLPGGGTLVVVVVVAAVLVALAVAFTIALVTFATVELDMVCACFGRGFSCGLWLRSSFDIRQAECFQQKLTAAHCRIGIYSPRW